MQKKPVLLIILDGFGYRKEIKYNAIAQAHKPNLDYWFGHYPHAILKAAGTAVGLPPGSIGNSEVGHLTIGAGRIIEQPETFLLNDITNGSFFKNKVLQEHLNTLARTGKALHITGLLSDAGVHCHEKIIHAFIKAAGVAGVSKIFVHPILDGRDVAPKSAAMYLERLEEVLKTVPQARIGSLHGRFYAMDRDENWERTERSYEIFVQAQKISVKGGWQEILAKNYSAGITDEFIIPVNLDPEAVVSDGDGIIFANYRPDRARQLTECFLAKNFEYFSRKNMKLESFITPVPYGSQIPTQIMYLQKPVKNTFKEILSRAGKTIFSIAETEKYAHVTYFFDGGREMAFPGETRVLIHSLPAKNYIDHPKMKAPEITKRVLESLLNDPADFYLINYANADMVGHSGDFEATKKAVEILDAQLGELFDVAVKKMHGTMFITADHGNAEDKFDEQSGQPRTSHTANPVPFLMLDESKKDGAKKLPLHQLGDIMGFILEFMGIKKEK